MAKPKSARKTKPNGKAKTSGVADWTVLVYLAGDNNLDAAGVVDLQEMKSVGSSDALNIVAQFDRAGGKGTTKRYRLRKGTQLAADMMKDLGETNTGDPTVLYDFLAWGVKNYPARHYLVCLWNHGAGWDDSNLYEGDYFGGAAPPITHKGAAIARSRSVARGAARAAPAARQIPLAQARSALRRARRALFTTTLAKMVQTRAIAFDDQAKDFIDNRELQRVMLKLKRLLKRKIDILGFDACLMSMVEIGYQIRDAAAYAVGSQEEEPNNGWPYDRILGALAKNPATAPGDLARAMVRHYLASYGTGSGVTFSASDLAEVPGVASAVSALGVALSNAVAEPAGPAALAQVRGHVQEYTAPYDEYVDLIDLCDGLDALVRRPDVAAATKAVRAAVAKLVVDAGFKGSAVARSHGTSIYFPKKKVCPLYATLDFARKGKWAAFIDDYVAAQARRGWA
jgi:hypothetical protein